MAGELTCGRAGLNVGVRSGIVSRLPIRSGSSGVMPLAMAISLGLT
jgi:hypothetical protein